MLTYVQIMLNLLLKTMLLLIWQKLHKKFNGCYECNKTPDRTGESWSVNTQCSGLQSESRVVWMPGALPTRKVVECEQHIRAFNWKFHSIPCFPVAICHFRHTWLQLHATTGTATVSKLAPADQASLIAYLRPHIDQDEEVSLQQAQFGSDWQKKKKRV